MDLVSILLNIGINIVSAIIVGIIGFIRKMQLTRKARKSALKGSLAIEFSNIWREFLVAQSYSEYQTFLNRINALLLICPNDKEIEFLKMKILEAITKTNLPIIILLAALVFTAVTTPGVTSVDTERRLDRAARRRARRMRMQWLVLRLVNSVITRFERRARQLLIIFPELRAAHC